MVKACASVWTSTAYARIWSRDTTPPHEHNQAFLLLMHFCCNSLEEQNIQAQCNFGAFFKKRLANLGAPQKMASEGQTTNTVNAAIPAARYLASRVKMNLQRWPAPQPIWERCGCFSNTPITGGQWQELNCNERALTVSARAPLRPHVFIT